ncbi:hypothetical protein OROGR_017432 [Orobanche gracilis]
MATESSEILEPHTSNSSLNHSGRAEIDTSAPFESVKEAADRFGGMGFWKPISHNPSSEHDNEVVDVVKLKEEAAQLERDLIIKESETLHVLKELESTKNIIEELKLKLHNEASEISAALKENPTYTDYYNAVPGKASEEERHETSNRTVQHPDGNNGFLNLCPSSAPGFILLELKQAKLNLTKTTNDLADIRTAVNTYKKRIDEERASLERTRKRLSSNTVYISSLDEELSQTRLELDEARGIESRDFSDIAKQLQHLSSETEQFKKVGQAAKSQVETAISDIEQMKGRIRTAEIRLIAARKTKEAARASERVALAEIKALSKSNCLHFSQQNSENTITLTFEEYSSLIVRVQESEQTCRGRVEDAMVKVDEANVSKAKILKRVEEAMEEVKVSKKALEEALNRAEIANGDKLAVEEALRVWRSEHRRNRRSVQSSTKFKNRRESHSPRPLDVNGLNLASDELKPVSKPTLSIGQILSRKLMLTEEYDNGMMQKENVAMGKRKVSLGQMLSKPSNDPYSGKKCGKENKELPAKRKKFGFARISLLVAKQSKKNKKDLSSSSMCRNA